MALTDSIQTIVVNGVTYATGGDPGGSLRAAWRQAAYVKANGCCAVCGKQTRLDAPATAHDRAEAGHVLPGQGRGGYQAGNIILMCRECNLAAGDRDLRGDLPRFVNPSALVTVKPTTTNVTGNVVTDAASIRRANGLGW